MTRTWKDNAAEAARLDAGEGWAFAMLVACSVEKGVGQNARGSRHRVRDDEKVSAQVFATEWGTSADRVLRYLKLWDREAAKVERAGRKPCSSAVLLPSHAWGPKASWAGFPEWKPNQMELGSKTISREPSAQKVADIRANTNAVRAAIVQEPKVAQAAIEALAGDPALRDVARSAIREQEKVAHEEAVTARRKVRKRGGTNEGRLLVAMEQALRDLRLKALPAAEDVETLSATGSEQFLQLERQLRAALDLIHGAALAGDWDDELAALIEEGA